MMTNKIKIVYSTYVSLEQNLSLIYYHDWLSFVDIQLITLYVKNNALSTQNIAVYAASAI